LPTIIVAFIVASTATVRQPTEGDMGNPGPRIEVDTNRCQGTGVCEAIAPDFFEVRRDGAMHIIRPDVDPARLRLIEDAVDSCPTLALRLSDE
jgi:ferredoxin